MSVSLEEVLVVWRCGQGWIPARRLTGCAPAGYDVSTQETYEATMASFDAIVGLKYLKGMHINDSKCGRPPACPRSC